MPFSPSQVSQMLDIPASSLRRYAKEFEVCLSPTARRKNRRRAYTQDDILNFRKIRELSGQGLSTEEIIAKLQIVESEPVEKDVLSLIPEVAREIEQLRAGLARIPELERQLAELNEKLLHERAMLRSLNSEFQDYKLQPWYKKFFSK